MLKSVMITGADKGLGFSLVYRFVHSGYRVFVGLYQPDNWVENLRADFSGSLVKVPLDVSQLESVKMAASQVAGDTPSLDILINNAGVHLGDDQPLEELDLDDTRLQRTMEVNAFGPLRVVQKFLPLLEKGQRRLIINISSEAGSITDCTRTAWFSYCMSKVALNMQSKILQNYLQPRGFKILAVHPGWMKTDMGGPDATFHSDESAKAIYQLAMRSWKPEEGIFFDYQGHPMNW